MKQVSAVLALAAGMCLTGAAFASEPFQNAAQTELKRQTTEAGLINKAAAKICKGTDATAESSKASNKANANNAKANAKVDKICGAESGSEEGTCPALYTDAPGGGTVEYPLPTDVDLTAAIEAQVEATCLAPPPPP